MTLAFLQWLLLTSLRIIIVDANSASPQLPGVIYYGIEKDHTGMCKFESQNAPGYRNISTELKQWVIDAPAVIQVRWQVEEEEREARALREARERILANDGITIVSQDPSGSQPPVTEWKDMTNSSPILPPDQGHFTANAPLSQADAPLFIHPEKFRPNAYFRGRDKELEDLHRMLMDKKRRDQGTSAVLIQAVPGGGKSCLAREYAFRHLADYAGGIFWIRGKAMEDLEDGFLKMAKNPTIRASLGLEDESALEHPAVVIPLVRQWLNQREDWLLILDGMLRDTPGLKDAIPDAKNTSLIITSTDSSIAGKYEFDSPRKLDLGPLAEHDAQTMLLELMFKKKPWSRDDLRHALTAVQLLDCLPLAVHAAAMELQNTQEPLSKYIHSYKNQPRAGALGAYESVHKKLHERGETAALNLMYLMSFFTSRIPVELLALGLKALDKRTPVLTRDSMGKGSLNKTFTVLILFALIERDEIDDIPSANSTSPTSSRKSSRSRQLLDVLKIHSVVQTFLRETLQREKQLDFWLERAAAVFCRSFDEGNARSKRNPDIGLPEDYRRYAAQCRKILGHIGRVDRPKPLLREAQVALKIRLRDIEERLSVQSAAVTRDAVEEDGKGPCVSIFERTNSLSIPSSGSTAETWFDWETDLPLEGTPYPQIDIIPGPTDIFSEERPASWDQEHIVPDHRTTRGLKLYSDRAGAWRETRLKVSEPRMGLRRTEPRVSLSKAVAVGRFSPVVSTPSQPGDSRCGTPVFTEAGQHLSHIRNNMSTGSNPEAAEARAALEGSVDSLVRNVGRPRGFSNPTPPRPNLVRLQDKRRGDSQDGFSSPFVGSDRLGGSHIPSARRDELARRAPSSQDNFVFPQIHSQSGLETDIGQWAPDLPVVISSTSSLTPAIHAHPLPHSGANSVGATSNSFPSIRGTSLQPPHWHLSQPDGYSSQPLSRDPSTSSLPGAPSEQSLDRPPRTLPIQARRAPSLARTEPSPRMPSAFDDPTTSYQIYQQRHHAGPWSSERAAAIGRREQSPQLPFAGLASSPSASDGADMVRSGSGPGGFQLNGRLVEFGQSTLGEVVYPPEMPDMPDMPELDDEPAVSAPMSRDGSRGRSRGSMRAPVGLGIVEEHEGTVQHVLPQDRV